MREIKFRAWDNQLKKMFEDIEYHGKYKCNEGEEIFVVMQFTGLKDKNGKEIYEGDIVKVVYYDRIKGEVSDVGEVTFDNIPCWFKFAGILQPHTRSIEKIRNIYENPELAKGRK